MRKTNLFDLFVRIGVKDEASGKLSGIASALGGGLKAAASVGVSAMGVAASGIAALTTAAVKNYAEYEQLIGGTELMLGDAYDDVMQKSVNAYKTVQMSQNEYLKQVNGFATGLKTALGGNEQAAADLAHKIIQAEADVVAATGVTQDLVQNAFNGIMKSNFTMLDNLQIGITPTKEGFQEVIDKVNEWNAANGNATSYQMGNLADMQSALVDYIDMVGMSGYAQKEALGTISGSWASAKAALSNLITAVAAGNGNFDALFANFIGSAKTVASNVLPVITKSLSGAAKLIEAIIPEVISVPPELIGEVLPQMAESAVSIVQALVDGLSQNAETLMTGAVQIITVLANGILSLLPQIISLGLQLVIALAQGLADNAPTLVPAVVDCVLLIMETLTENSVLLISAGVQLIGGLLNGLLQAIPNVVMWFLTQPQVFADALINGAPSLLEAGKALVGNVMNGFVMAWNSFSLMVKGLVNDLLASIYERIASLGGGVGGEILNAMGFDGPLAISTTFEEDKIRDAKRSMGVYVNQNITAVPQSPGQLASATQAAFETARW